MAQTPTHERHGVIVQHAFGQYPEAAFVEDPAEIEALRRAGQSWRLQEAVLIETAD